jgi:hypothetical protein
VTSAGKVADNSSMGLLRSAAALLITLTGLSQAFGQEAQGAKPPEEITGVGPIEFGMSIGQAADIIGPERRPEVLRYDIGVGSVSYRSKFDGVSYRVTALAVDDKIRRITLEMELPNDLLPEMRTGFEQCYRLNVWQVETVSKNFGPPRYKWVFHEKRGGLGSPNMFTVWPVGEAYIEVKTEYDDSLGTCDGLDVVYWDEPFDLKRYFEASPYRREMEAGLKGGGAQTGGGN